MPTAQELITDLVKLKIDLIPIKPGTKRPAEDNWNTPIRRHTATVLSRFAKIAGLKPKLLDDISADAFTELHANIGVLNETSQLVTLDCDSPQAGTALQAAAAVLNGDVKHLYDGAGWTSVKGMKVMFRRPPKLTATRTVFKVWNGTHHDVIFELRGTGQDVLPPSWRADAKVRLAWIDGMPKSIPPMPGWLSSLYKEMVAGKGPAIDAMFAALGASPDQRRRSQHYNLMAYPGYCSGYAPERAFVNAKYPVEELLAQYGYEQNGTRWRPIGATTSAGIIAPRSGRDENWLCEHEGDPLAGVFDSFRLLVELEFDGDPKATAESIRLEQRAALSAGAGQVIVDEPEPEEQDERDSKAGRADGPTPATGERVPEVQADKPGKQKSKRQHGAVSHQFFQETYESIKPIVTGLIDLPPGAHILSAMPKAGKSTFATAMAMTVASAASISGLTVGAAMPVLYCAFDESVQQDLQPRMKALVKGKALTVKTLIDNLTIIDVPDALLDWSDEQHIDCDEPLGFEWRPKAGMTEDQIEAREALLRPRYSAHIRALYHYLARNKIRFCVIDVIAKMRSRADGNVPVYDRELGEWSAINAIGLASNCAIIAVHHMNKEAAGRNAGIDVNSLAKVSGSNAIAGSVQSIISMSRFTGRDVDQEVLYEIEPKGKKIILDHISRGVGREAMALSLVARPVDGAEQPMLEWIHMGRAELLLSADEQAWTKEWLFLQPSADYFSADVLFTAAVSAGATGSRGRDTFRKLMMRMHRGGVLDVARGPGGGYRLSNPARLIMDRVKAGQKY